MAMLRGEVFARRLRCEPLEDRRMLSVTGSSESLSSDALQMFHTQDALFAENAGQWAADNVYFGYNKGGTQIYFTDDSIEFGLSRGPEKGDWYNLCAAPEGPSRQIVPVPFFGDYDDASGKSVVFSRTADGVYTVGVQVVDDDVAYDMHSTTVTVYNVAPTAHAGGPYVADQGGTITLIAAGSTDPGNDIASYQWDFDGDGQFNDASGISVAFSSTVPGENVVSVLVTDDDGGYDACDAIVTVNNTPPTAEILSNASIAANETVFSVNYSDINALSTATIGANDIFVTGPNSYSRYAELISIDDYTDGSPRIATYRVTPPGSLWRDDDFGEYQITMVADQVYDTSGASVPAGSLGIFSITRTEDDELIIQEDDAPNIIPAGYLVDNDVSVGPLMVDSVEATFNTHGTVDLAGQTVVYTPDASFNGWASFNYTTINQWGYRSTGIVTVLCHCAITVDNLEDNVDLDGLITLREAIEAANKNLSVGDATAGWDGLDRIDFDPSLFADGPGTIVLDGSSLAITEDLEILGPGADKLVIDADGRSNVIRIINGVTATIDGVTITGGADNSGGGIYNSGMLTVANSTISGNSANDGGGITIYGNSSDTSLTVIGSTIAGNSADRGGGIYNNSLGGTATLAITDSIISDNSAYEGGGLYSNVGFYSNSFGTATIIDSTFSENSAIKDGGGIRNYSGEMTISSSRFNGNSAGEDGGGVRTHYGTMRIENSSFSGNSADEGGGIFIGGGLYTTTPSYPDLFITNSTLTGNLASSRGGGIFTSCNHSFPTTTLNNTIVAKNTSPDRPDIAFEENGTITGSYSIIGDDSDQNALINGSGGNIVGTTASPTDPRFLRDAWDGGDGWRDDPGTANIDESANNDYGDMRIEIDSPAFDAGSDSLAVDAEGSPLANDLLGGSRILFTCVDIGAHEYAPPIDVRAIVVTGRSVLDTDGEKDVLPPGADWIDEWQPFFVEIWVDTPSTDQQGVPSALVDLQYDTGCHTATAIEYGPGFESNHSGTIDDKSGTISGVGAATSRMDVGDDRWALLARVRFEPTASDAGVPIHLAGEYLDAVACGIELQSPQDGSAEAVPCIMQFGPGPHTQLRAVPYDMDDDGTVGLADLSFFASVYGEKPGITTDSPYAYAADFNRSGTIDLGDLAFFASNYRSARPNTAISYPVEFNELPLATTAVILSADSIGTYDNGSTDSDIMAAKYKSMSSLFWTNEDASVDNYLINGATIMAYHWIDVENSNDEDARDAVFAEVGTEDKMMLLFDEV
ncbi:MAG: hypothetical protein JXM70_13400 [Pirellulales bacterium]|nr:hypothetical protein [Pirellulales bacterium]